MTYGQCQVQWSITDAAASSRGVEGRWFGAYVAGEIVARNSVMLDMSEAGDGGAW
jgi:hypothetical protein